MTINEYFNGGMYGTSKSGKERIVSPKGCVENWGKLCSVVKKHLHESCIVALEKDVNGKLSNRALTKALQNMADELGINVTMLSCDGAYLNRKIARVVGIHGVIKASSVGVLFNHALIAIGMRVRGEFYTVK